MKLTSAQVERTLGQFEAQAIPDDHPVVPQLNDLFGEHTFFLDSNGLNIVEPAEPARAGAQSAKVVNLASWSEANPTDLELHDPGRRVLASTSSVLAVSFTAHVAPDVSIQSGIHVRINAHAKAGKALKINRCDIFASLSVGDRTDRAGSAPVVCDG